MNVCVCVRVREEMEGERERIKRMFLLNMFKRVAPTQTFFIVFLQNTKARVTMGGVSKGCLAMANLRFPAVFAVTNLTSNPILSKGGVVVRIC